VLLHATALEAAGISADNFKKDDALSFDVEVARDGRMKASNIRLG
jgi:hypothetical protein